MKLSIIIKTLNEEDSIARAIASAVAAVAPYDGEVIVADGGSTDQTVEVALAHPVTVVRLQIPEERCCGIGPQLGYQHSRGEYIYILDGDMELDSGFVADAIDLLDRDPSIAGVGGVVVEQVLANIEFKSRQRHFAARRIEDQCDVACLTGGGLYRRAAIQDVLYFSDRNLHGFEEYDLGARLRLKQWRVVRFERRRAVDHYSHSMGTYQLLWNRLRAGRLLAVGEILRSAIERGYLRRALAELRPIRFALGVLVYWPIICVVSLALPSASWVAALFSSAALVPIAVMAARSKSIKAGFYSVVVWHLTAAALIVGFARPRKPPTNPVNTVTVANASAASEGTVRAIIGSN